ncbi:MAG: hypothetical protein V7K67_07875 [Nostoc sp.]
MLAQRKAFSFRDATRSQHGTLFQLRECLNYPAIVKSDRLWIFLR